MRSSRPATRCGRYSKSIAFTARRPGTEDAKDVTNLAKSAEDIYLLDSGLSSASQLHKNRDVQARRSCELVIVFKPRVCVGLSLSDMEDLVLSFYVQSMSLSLLDGDRLNAAHHVRLRHNVIEG